MYVVCKHGDVDEINEWIQDGYKNWNEGLDGACESGHVNIIDLMISKGATYFNQGLAAACFGGHIPAVNIMISKGADNYQQGLLKAALGGKLETTQLMLEYGAKLDVDVFRNACKGGNINIINIFKNTPYVRPNIGLEAACQSGKHDIIDLMISNGADVNVPMNQLIASKNANITAYMIIHGAVPTYESIRHEEYVYFLLATVKTRILLKYDTHYFNDWHNSNVIAAMNNGVKFDYDTTNYERTFTKIILDRKHRQKLLFKILMNSKSKLLDKNIAEKICNFVSFKRHLKE
jgi:hypothetical protein